ncbi:hypothetical protein VP01_772g3 [Puccinia sorghi]|uniref:Uncharacterized protein n=1 Tax=Puccinia sorghi TaxID=27349 RepID=A0A0L6UBJ7_9BASI|nr:hypothetical protein VP01_772g3 [Puccinia sorghi]
MAILESLFKELQDWARNANVIELKHIKKLYFIEIRQNPRVQLCIANYCLNVSSFNHQFMLSCFIKKKKKTILKILLEQIAKSTADEFFKGCKLLFLEKLIYDSAGQVIGHSNDKLDLHIMVFPDSPIKNLDSLDQTCLTQRQ